MKRIISFDIARSIAIICVILCHAVEYRQFSLINSGNFIVSIFSYLTYTTLFLIGRLGVPVFLMLTGALLINTKKEIKLFQFYKKKLFPLVITTEIWIIINYFFDVIFFQSGFEIHILLRQMLFFQDAGSRLGHMWYMLMIIGVYIVIPLINYIVLHVRKRDLFIIVLLSFLPYLINIFSLFFEFTLNISPIAFGLDFTPLGGVFLAYVIIGYIIYNLKLYRFKKIIMIISLFSFLFIVLLQTCLFKLGLTNYNIILWYTDPFILIVTIGLFYLFCSKKNMSTQSFCQSFFYQISIKSFAIYFIHYPVLIILYQLFEYLPINLIIRSIFLTIFTFTCSYIISSILMKNKKVSLILFGR